MDSSANKSARRPVRIGAFSGAVGDRFDALRRQAETGNVDILFGDYLAELNIAWRALELRDDPSKGYEISFLHHLASAVDTIASKKLKVITDAGALNPKGLSEAVDALLKSKGHKLRVAYVSGDDILPRFEELRKLGEQFEHLEDRERHISSWQHKPLTVSAYCGAQAIVAALHAGADIIITGRVTDASPVIAAALWWHGWDWSNYDALAGALLAGHCIECGAYVTGANFSGFKQILNSFFDFAFPIAEISADGTFVVTKQMENFNGMVTVDTVRSQFLYEIQGNVYLNPDVQALLDNVTITQEGHDRVRVAGLKGLAPPETTKVAICALAGYQAEVSFFATGLDTKEKFDTVKLQIDKSLGANGLKQFDVFDFSQYGVPQEDPQSESEATAMLRIFAQAQSLETFGPAKSLLALIMPDGLGHYPGMHINMDLRMTVPKPYIEYWPARMKVKHLKLEAHLLDSDRPIKIKNHLNTMPIVQQTDIDSKERTENLQLGPTERGPLGWIVHARSGDKGGNANVGFFVRHELEYPWLKAVLSKSTLVRLLAKEYANNKIERVEFPGIWAVHFVIHDYLGNGVSSTARLDSLAKSVAEYLRAKHVDIPKKFLARGKL